MFKVTLDTTDTNTVGTLDVLMAEAATFLPVHKTFMVLPANVYDSLMGTDLLDINAAQWLGTACAAPTTAGVPEVDVTFIGGVAQSLADLKDLVDTGYNPTTHAIVLVDTCTANTDMVGTNSAALASVLGAAVGASISADIAAIPLTAMRGTDSAALASVCTEARLAELAAANLPADVDTLKTYCDILDHATNGLAAIKAEVEGIGGVAMRGTDSAALEATLTTMKQKVAGAFDRETDSLEAIRDRGDVAWITGGGGAAPTAAEVADAVLDEVVADHTDSGSVGEKLGQMIKEEFELG